MPAVLPSLPCRAAPRRHAAAVFSDHALENASRTVNVRDPRLKGRH